MSIGPDVILESRSVADTQGIGACLGRRLARTDVIGLVGPLGAGKTALIQGIAAGAGVIDRRQVNSPTFVIVNEYNTQHAGPPLRIFHIDAYRLRGPDDLSALGFEEMVEQGAVLIEWADKVLDLLPAGALVIEIQPTGATERRLISLAVPSSDSLADALHEAGRQLEAHGRPD